MHLKNKETKKKKTPLYFCLDKTELAQLKIFKKCGGCLLPPH